MKKLQRQIVERRGVILRRWALIPPSLMLGHVEELYSKG